MSERANDVVGVAAAELGEFHWRHGIMWSRLPAGDVRLRAPFGDWVIPLPEWVSILAAVRAGVAGPPTESDTLLAWEFMGGGGKPLLDMSQHHNGYNPAMRADFPSLREPTSPTEALRLLLDEAEELGKRCAAASPEDERPTVEHAQNCPANPGNYFHNPEARCTCPDDGRPTYTELVEALRELEDSYGMGFITRSEARSHARDLLSRIPKESEG